MKTCSPHQFHEKKKEKKCWFCVVYERWMCCSMWVLCVLSLRKCLCLDKKKRKKKKRITAFILAPFCLWPPDTDRWSIRSPPLRTRKKCLAQCFPSHVFYLRKKQPFGFYKKKAKSQTEKLRIAIKQKREWKREKKSSKQRLTPHTPHTRSKLHNIHTLIHQNFIHKYHPCHQINQSTKLPILDFYSSLIAAPKH